MNDLDDQSSAPPDASNPIIEDDLDLESLFEEDIVEEQAPEEDPKAAPPDLGQATDAPVPSPAGHLASGDVLALDDGSVILYRQPVPSRPYDFIYELRAGAALEARGLPVAEYGPRRLGRLDKQLFRQMVRLKCWDRDAIVGHLDHWAFGRFVPNTDGALVVPRNSLADQHVPRSVSQPAPAAAPVPGPVEEDDELPRRGTRVTIRKGGHSWEAIYWGNEPRGAILAHNTGGSWILMHMDLDRFGKSVEYGPVLPPDEVDRIAEEITSRLA